MDLLAFVFAIEIGGAALPATISLSSRKFTFWGPFFIIHIGILLIGLDHIIDNHNFGALEKLVGLILLFAVQLVYFNLWQRESDAATQRAVSRIWVNRSQIKEEVEYGQKDPTVSSKSERKSKI